MRNDFYPAGTVQALLQTDLLTPQTKGVLQQRLTTPTVTSPHFFSVKKFRTLQAICSRLMPQPPEREQLVDLAGILDNQLAESFGNGWRYDVLPDDKETFTKGIQGIEETSQNLYSKGFQDIKVNEQDDILYLVQEGKAKGAIWQSLNSKLFFEELLAALCEIYYSHPIGKEEIGDISMADAKGWHNISYNHLDAQEPKPLNAVADDE